MRETADTTWHNYEQDGMVWNGLRWKKKDEPPDEDESYEKPFLLEEPGITLPPRSPMEDHPDWPEVVDPELEAMEYDDPYAEEKKPLIFEDMRYDPSKPDITYLPPWLRKYVPPPTRQSMREGEEMMFKPCYIDDDPRNTWVYKDPHIPKISTIVRKEWGALGWKPKRPLNVPVRNMRITYTGGETDNYPEAFRIVQNLQKKHRQAGLDDIAWNWIIGKDGAIYEGRGWYADAKRPKGWEHLSGDCLDICYLGDFDEKDPPWYLLKSTIDIMRYAMEINVLDPNFKLIQLRSNPK